jgi:hypothetical protein
MLHTKVQYVKSNKYFDGRVTLLMPTRSSNVPTLLLRGTAYDIDRHAAVAIGYTVNDGSVIPATRSLNAIKCALDTRL